MTAATRRSWVAAYDTSCATCPAAIAPGDRYFYAPGSEAASGMDCCGDRDDADLVVTERPDDSSDEGLTVDASQVMPRGRTARDACGTCWQVPASNGACGCHT